MRGNRSELAPGRKSPRCHVNTPLELEPSMEIENSSCYREFEENNQKQENGMGRNASIMHTSLQGQQEI